MFIHEAASADQTGVQHSSKQSVLNWKLLVKVKLLFIEADQQMACKKYDLLGLGNHILPTMHMRWGECVPFLLHIFAEVFGGKKKKSSSAPCRLLEVLLFHVTTPIVANYFTVFAVILDIKVDL